MSAFWRQVGMNYVQYSSICAAVVRRSLQPKFKADAMKREATNIKLTKWKDGKPEAVKAAQ